MPDHAVCHRDIDRLLAHTSVLQRALKDIQHVVCSIDGPTWEEAQEARHPLWEALNAVDQLALQALTCQIERTTHSDGSACGA